MLSFFKKVLFTFIFIIILIIAYYIYEGYNMYNNAVKATSLSDKIFEIQNNVNYTKLEDISKTYIDAVVATEDHRFFDHSGVDYISLLRAIIINVKDKELEQGGSTISQQLAKNMYFTQEKNLNRKIAEVFVVYNLEKNYSKEQILELYINTIYFGNGCYGIKEGSLGFFNKEPSKLTDYEATFLAGITNAPSIYSSKRHSDLANQRHKTVLNAMVKYNKLTQEEADTIYNSNN